jgi:hypothetical protein
MMIKKSDMKEFCKLAGIDDCNERNIRKYLDSYKYAPRYLRGLTEDEKYLRKFEIRYGLLKEKELKKKGIEYKDIYKPTRVDKLYRERKGVPTKTIKYSKYTEQWNEKYPNCKDIPCKSRVSGVSTDILKRVANKGAAAWRGGAHRPGATRENWMVSRVNSFLLCGKTWQFPDHLLAKEALESPKVKRFWSKCDKSMLGVKTRSR